MALGFILPGVNTGSTFRPLAVIPELVAIVPLLFMPLLLPSPTFCCCIIVVNDVKCG